MKPKTHATPTGDALRFAIAGLTTEEVVVICALDMREDGVADARTLSRESALAAERLAARGLLHRTLRRDETGQRFVEFEREASVVRALLRLPD